MTSEEFTTTIVPIILEKVADEVAACTAKGIAICTLDVIMLRLIKEEDLSTFLPLLVTALEGVPGYSVVQHDDRFICIEW